MQLLDGGEVKGQSSAVWREEGEEDRDSTIVFYYTTIIVLPGRGIGNLLGGGEKLINNKDRKKVMCLRRPILIHMGTVSRQSVICQR